MPTDLEYSNTIWQFCQTFSKLFFFIFWSADFNFIFNLCNSFINVSLVTFALREDDKIDKFSLKKKKKLQSRKIKKSCKLMNNPYQVTDMGNHAPLQSPKVSVNSWADTCLAHDKRLPRFYSPCISQSMTKGCQDSSHIALLNLFA